jgi:hypothetical protein
MRQFLLVAAAVMLSQPAIGAPAEPAPPLPAGVDRDMLCQLLISNTAARTERLPEERRAGVAQMLTSLEHSESFYIGGVITRLSDAQITAAADKANTALVNASEDQRAGHLHYYLNDATLRSRHYYQQLTAH